MTDHPYPPGARVYHLGQEWGHGVPGGTGEVLSLASDRSQVSSEDEGSADAYEYRVRTGRDFSRRPGPDNPEDRTTTWSGWAIRPALTAEQGEEYEATLERLRKLTGAQRKQLAIQVREVIERWEEGPELDEALRLDDALDRVDKVQYGIAGFEI